MTPYTSRRVRNGLELADRTSSIFASRRGPSFRSWKLCGRVSLRTVSGRSRSIAPRGDFTRPDARRHRDAFSYGGGPAARQFVNFRSMPRSGTFSNTYFRATPPQQSAILRGFFSSRPRVLEYEHVQDAIEASESE